MIQYLGLWLMIAWGAGVWAAMDVLRSGAGALRIALWLAALLVPVLGFAAWYVFGPRRKAG